MSRAVFIDAGGTLTPIPTLISFIHFYGGKPGSFIPEMQRNVDAGADRKSINEQYYRAFAGESWAEVSEAGYRWFTESKNKGKFYRPEVLDRIRSHKEQGDIIILVSGSWRVCLEPFKDDIGVDEILCSEPNVTDDGYLTGELTSVMVGSGKSEAIIAFAHDRGIDLTEAVAYGDDPTDLDMLNLVGNPVVISGFGLDDIATEKGWEIIVPDHAYESEWGPGVK